MCYFVAINILRSVLTFTDVKLWGWVQCSGDGQEWGSVSVPMQTSTIELGQQSTVNAAPDYELKNS